MKPRPTWTGHLKLSLLTIPIRVYNAVSEADKISFNQLHKDCHQRLRQQLICPVHGKVERDAVEKGYEVDKDQFVVLTQAEIEDVQLETTRTVELLQFIDASQLDPIYLDAPYYLGPDGRWRNRRIRFFATRYARRGASASDGSSCLAGKRLLPSCHWKKALR
jgi:DNA end-binding protein Ku